VEGAVRVLVGDAVAQAVHRVGEGVQREVSKGVANLGRAFTGGGRRG